MPAKKRRIEQPEVVKLFAARLRERRLGAGLSQVELASQAHLAQTYIGRLESAATEPGIATVARLAAALGTSIQDLLPEGPPPDRLTVLKDRAETLFQELLKKSDRELMQVVVPLLARFLEVPARSR